MYESHLTKKIWTDFELNLVSQGKGIDIGAGQSGLISPNAIAFDLNDGDANHIQNYVQDEFDFVFSSHCLEHMQQPFDALKQWWNLVKPNGHLIILVPDEDLYEQGYFPSLFNDDHKWTFTIAKRKSWSPKSINVLDLIASLENHELINLELQDLNYDRSKQIQGVYSTKTAFVLRKILKHIAQILRIPTLGLVKLPYRCYARIFKLPIDQNQALRQIQFILRKKSEL